MNYKIYLYTIFLFLGIFILSGVNINTIIRQGKRIEGTLLVMTLSCIFSYLLTNFVVDFLNLP